MVEYNLKWELKPHPLPKKKKKKKERNEEEAASARRLLKYDQLWTRNPHYF
jgi:hypothetical protein